MRINKLILANWRGITAKALANILLEMPKDEVIFFTNTTCGEWGQDLQEDYEVTQVSRNSEGRLVLQ